MTGLVIRVQDKTTREIKDFTILGSIPLQSARMKLEREFRNASTEQKRECSFSLGSARYDWSDYKVDWNTWCGMTAVFG